MAKGILSFFGGLSILAGFVVIGFSVEAAARTRDGWIGIAPAVGVGALLLITGAPLLGFARVITLLERIAHNTGGAPGDVPAVFPNAPQVQPLPTMTPPPLHPQPPYQTPPNFSHGQYDSYYQNQPR